MGRSPCCRACGSSSPAIDLRLTGSDLDLTITVDAPPSPAGDDGVGVLPAKLVTDIVRALEPGAVEVEVGDEEARISVGPLAVLACARSPRTSSRSCPIPPISTVELDAAAFADALRQVVPAASVDESRPILTGVLMAAEGDGLRLVATDSYRLAVRDLPGHVGAGRRPERARAVERAQASSPGCSATTRPSRAPRRAGRVVRRSANVRLMTRLIEGEFPNYRGLIPARAIRTG